MSKSLWIQAGLIIVLLLAAYTVGRLAARAEMSLITYQAPTLTQDSTWPAVFYMRGQMASTGRICWRSQRLRGTGRWKD
jgi:hypothetical protein